MDAEGHLIRWELLDKIVYTPAQIAAFASSEGIDLTHSIQQWLTTVGRGSIPRAGCVIFDQESGFTVADPCPNPFLFGINLFGLYDSIISERISRFPEFSSHPSGWTMVGSTAIASSILVGDGCFGIVAEYGDLDDIEIVQGSLLDLEKHIYVNIDDLLWIKECSVQQLQVVFADVWCPELEAICEDRCQATAANNWIVNSIHLYLPKSRMVQIFEAHALSEMDEVSRDGWYPIHVAAKYGRLDALDLLVQYGADVSLSSSDGAETAFSVALKSTNIEFAKKLLSFGYSPTSEVDRREINNREVYQLDFLFDRRAE